MPHIPDHEPAEIGGRDVEPNDASRSRKRRRVLACDTCRRIKSRCDYDRVEGLCNRCRNLRLPCSLTGPGEVRSVPKEKEANAPATELALIQELHARISEQSAMLKELKDIVQVSQVSSRQGTLTSSGLVSSQTSPATQTATEDTISPVDRDTDSAPVVMIRNLNTTRRNVPPNAQSGRNRLTNHGLKGLLDLELFPRSVAIDLLKIFFARNGNWLQVTSWDSMGVDPDLESMSSLLITSCVLQGVRYSGYANKKIHEVLYEHLRRILASVLLISPLPMEALYSLAIVSNWNMAPDKMVEFMDSWLLSGHCVQQAMLTINFTEIHASIKSGKSNTSTRAALRLWNTFCLTHLYFAMGTGRPSIIAGSYLDQCSSILNVVEASIEDGIMVAEISLYSTIIKLLAAPLPIRADEKGKELEAWHEKWAHLLEVRIDRALIFRMSYHFGYLVLAQRSLKNLTTGHSNPENIFSTPSPPNPKTINGDHRQYIILSIKHSTALLETLMRLPPKTAEEVPDNILLSIIYAVIILATCYEDSPDPTANINTIREAITFCKKAKVAPMAGAEFAASKIEAKRLENDEGQVEATGAEGFQNFENYGKEAFLGWEFPTLEDLFGGSFLNGPLEDGYNFHLAPL